MDAMQPHLNRRKRLADEMRARGGGIAVLFTAPEVPRNRDSDFPYRWDSYFYYLTGFPEPQAALVLRVSDGCTESVLFCREKNALHSARVRSLSSSLVLASDPVARSAAISATAAMVSATSTSISVNPRARADRWPTFTAPRRSPAHC